MTIVQLLTSFDGRIGRAGFWLGMLFLAAIAAVFSAIAYLMGLPPNLLEADSDLLGTKGVALLLAEAAVMGFTQFALFAKRWHDRGKSGWWSLIVLVPGLGFFWWLIECGMLEGDPGPNAYGAAASSVRPQLV